MFFLIININKTRMCIDDIWETRVCKCACCTVISSTTRGGLVVVNPVSFDAFGRSNQLYYDLP